MTRYAIRRQGDRLYLGDLEDAPHGLTWSPDVRDALQFLTMTEATLYWLSVRQRGIFAEAVPVEVEP